ncbi:hypothetical protein ACK8HH_17115 [Gordonia sp. LUNF6]|uniref:hypothetical protein n=1 Tax=unclassified Gordonia (in: high G+C Gram-positive bacteria) TaxID=2657482 RepID=UPI00398ADF81
MECSPYVLAASLLANLQANLADTRAGAADRIAVYPHQEPAVEFCDSMAWVGIGAIAPAQTKPVGGCGVLTWRLTLTMGVHRCYPVTEDGSAPDAAAVDSAARDILDDGEAMRRAVTSAFEDEQPQITGWRPVPPQGGSHGSRMDVQVEMAWGAYTEPRAPMLPGDPRQP